MTSQPTPEAVEAVAGYVNDALNCGNFYHPSSLWDEMPEGSSGKAECRDDATRLLAFIRDAIHRDGDDADAIRQTLGLRAEWAATDSTSRDLRLWPESGGTRAEAESEFVNDGDDVILCRVVGEWQEVRP